MMKKMMITAWLTAVFTIFLGINSVFSQSMYNLEIISQTGVAVGGGVPMTLGQEPSINDAGKVAFIARDTDATHGRVMTLNNGIVEQDCFIGTIASVADDVEKEKTD